MRPSSLPYRPGVGLMLLNQERRVFVAKRLDMKIGEAWQMPQGGIDEGEEPQTAAFREMREEIGTDKAQIIAESAAWYDYDLPPELIGRVWGGKYRGQRQKWYLLNFTGTDADINIATEEPEFSEWQWAAPATLPELIVPFKKPLYTALLEEFRVFL